MCFKNARLYLLVVHVNNNNNNSDYLLLTQILTQGLNLITIFRKLLCLDGKQRFENNQHFLALLELVKFHFFQSEHMEIPRSWKSFLHTATNSYYTIILVLQKRSLSIFKGRQLFVKILSASLSYVEFLKCFGFGEHDRAPPSVTRSVLLPS